MLLFLVCHLFLFILQTGSFATISNLLHYIAFYNYTIIGASACNQWCTIVQLIKWTIKWFCKLGRHGPNFLADLRTYASTVWPAAVKFGILTYMGRSVFSFMGINHTGARSKRTLIWDAYIRWYRLIHNDSIHVGVACLSAKARQPRGAGISRPNFWYPNLRPQRLT